ncbi:MAG: hypothetical protein Q9187_003865 [Circinaria calcarea]
MAPQEPKQPWVQTPLIESAALSKAAGCRIFLKLENLQPSGSFKSRGIGNLIRRAILSQPSPSPSPSTIHFYSSSGGNAGLACVTAAHTLGYPATVIVPLSTKPLMISKIRAAGATDVVQKGATWSEADRYLRGVVLANNPHGIYVPPFDHPHVWEGTSTMVGEVAQQLEYAKPDALICSVGGGGLFCGLMQGIDQVWNGEVDVLAVETNGADSLNASLKAGELVTLPGITSMATSLGAVRVAPKAFEYGRRSNVTSVVLADAEAAMGCWRLADDERMLVEAACGVSVALCYDGRLKKLLPRLTAESRVVVVLCGGSNITLEMLAEFRRKYADVEELATKDEGVPSTLSAPDGHMEKD